MIHAALQIVGLALIALGAWMLAPWLGVTVLGAGCLLLGVVLEWERRRNARKPD